MATITRFEDLEIWQLARVLSKKIYTLTYKEPLSSDFRLKDQMRGSSGSIMDNIAEGFERGSRFEFINSLSISKGEIGELKSQLYRSLDNTYISEMVFKEFYEDADIYSTKFNGQKFKNRDRK
jgi:four helix bundle protein